MPLQGPCTHQFLDSRDLLILNPVLQESFVWSLSGSSNLGGKGTVYTGLPCLKEQGWEGAMCGGAGNKGGEAGLVKGQTETRRTLV